MRTYFIDIDGTLVKWGTTVPLPGAVECIKKLAERGDRIVFTTQREEDSKDFDNKELLKFLMSICYEGKILWGCTSPRILVNDAPCYAIQHKMNTLWIETAQELLAIEDRA